MKFKVYEAKEDNRNEYEVSVREFHSLEELMDTIENEWWWAKVEISTACGNEIYLRFDESVDSEAWNE